MSIDLDELSRLHAAATPAPWDYDGMHAEITTPQGDHYWLIISTCRETPDQAFPADQFGHAYDANFALIAAARNALPELIARCRQQWQLLDEAADLISALHDGRVLSGEAAAREVAEFRYAYAAIAATAGGA